MNEDIAMYVKVACLAVALLVGFAAGRHVGSSGEGTDHRAQGEAVAGRPAPAAPPGPVLTPRSSEADQLRERVAQLEDQVALHRRLEEAYEQELYGEPIPWTSDLPDDFQPELFKMKVAEAMTDCQADLVGFECDEPPCLALLRGHDPGYNGSLNARCPGWVTHFGETSSGYHTSIDCGDGRTERVHMVSPFPYGTLFAEDDDEARSNHRKRRQQRYAQIELGWECARK